MADYITISLQAEQHLIEDHANWPDVRLIIVLVASQDLGSHIEGWAKHSLSEFLSAE